MTKSDEKLVVELSEKIVGLKAERDTWAIAAEILSVLSAPCCEFPDGGPKYTWEKCPDIPKDEWFAMNLAAAYPIAEAYGVNWREGVADNEAGYGQVVIEGAAVGVVDP